MQKTIEHSHWYNKLFQLLASDKKGIKIIILNLNRKISWFMLCNKSLRQIVTKLKAITGQNTAP